MILTRTAKTAARRTGFTLVELLVATALTMLIMSIIASSFQTAMDSLSHLRSAGELQDRLRSGSEKLRLDLQAPHFEDEAVKRGKLREVRHDQNPNFRPRSGFFHIGQGSESIAEHSGIPAQPRDYSTKAVNHGLMFTVKLPGNSRQSLFTAPRVVPPAGFAPLDNKNDNLILSPLTTYASRWAIVSYFLSPSGENTLGPSPQPLYHLHRRVRLLAEVPNTFINPFDPNSANYFFDDRKELRTLTAAPSTYSAPFPNPNFGRVYTPTDRAVTDGNAKFDKSVIDAASTIPTNIRSAWTRPNDMFTPAADGSDIVMSNLLCFEVKSTYNEVLTSVVKNGTTVPIVSQFPRKSIRTVDLSSPPYISMGVAVDNYNANNKDYPYDDLPPMSARAQLAARAFDTGSGGGTDPLTANVTSASAPPAAQPFRVKGIQVKLRIYDPKNKTTRQATIVQEM
jgi:type II secretory pathway pseudopilin PulG